MWRFAALVLAIALAAPGVFAQRRGQERRPAPEEKEEEGLIPFPPMSMFQGRPLYHLNDEEIKPPKLYEAPEPEPLKNFRPARVVVWCIVGYDGKPYMIRMAKRDSLEADQRALQMVSKYRWKPGQLKNQDVDVLLKVEVVWR